MFDLYRLFFLLLATLALAPQSPLLGDRGSSREQMTPFAQSIYAGTVFGEDVVRRELRTPERLFSPAPQPLPEPYTPRWRLGVGVPEMTPLGFDWPVARPGWFHNWTFGIIDEGLPAGPEEVRLTLAGDEAALGMEYLPLLRTLNGQLYFSAEEIGLVARAYPGRTWLVGNEPDVEAQDWATPAEYATAYHAAYHAIKRADPTAQVAAGGLSQVTPLRLRYLDAVWAAYEARYGEPMPVDVWTMHAFILREEVGEWGVGVPPGLDPSITTGLLWGVEDHADLDEVARQIWRMRQWMADHDQQNKPLWVTEYGILLPTEMGFTPSVVSEFMLGSFELFEGLRDPLLGYAADQDRLVQRWMWFSTNFPELPAGNLFDDTGQPTPVMDAMTDYLSQLHAEK
jgi:hypothetical protein